MTSATKKVDVAVYQTIEAANGRPVRSSAPTSTPSSRSRTAASATGRSLPGLAGAEGAGRGGPQAAGHGQDQGHPAVSAAHHGLGRRGCTEGAGFRSRPFRYYPRVRLSLAAAARPPARARRVRSDDEERRRHDRGRDDRARRDDRRRPGPDQGRPRDRHRRPRRPLVQLPREQGPAAGESELGVDGRVVISKAEADYVPNLTTLREAGLRPRDRRRLPDGLALEKVAARLPDVNFAIIDSSQADMKSKPKNVRGLLFKEQEAGYLVGYLAGLITKAEAGAKQVIGSVGGLKIPPVDRYIAGYQAGAEAATRGSRPQRLLAGLRRPGEVQGARARPDRPRRARRLPGRGPVRPRRPLGRAGEEHARDRRRRRPGLPRRAHRDERAEEGRRGRLPDGPGRRGRRLQRRRGHDLRRRLRRGRDRGDLADVPADAVAEVKRVQDEIADGTITDIPETVKGSQVREALRDGGHPPRGTSRIAADGRAACSRAPWDHEAVPRHRRERQRRLRPAQGRGARAPGRERRRQVDADERPLRPLPPGRGRDPDRRQAGRARLAEGGDRERRRDGPPALHADPGDDGGREHRPRDRARAQGRPARLRGGGEARARDLDPLRARRRPARARPGHHGRPAAAGRDPEGALPRCRHPRPRRADGRADAAGGAGALRDHPEPDRAGQVDHLHQPQAERGAEIADRITVLRRGKKIETLPAAGATEEEPGPPDGRPRGAAPRRQGRLEPRPSRCSGSRA